MGGLQLSQTIVGPIHWMIAHHRYHYDLRFGGAKQDPQVADVGSGWTGDDQVAELFKEGVGIAASEKISGIQTEIASPFEGRFVCDRTGSRTITVYAVGAGAQNNSVTTILPVFLVENDSAAQNRFQVSAATSIPPNRAGQLAPGNQTKSLVGIVGKQLRKQKFATRGYW